MKPIMVVTAPVGTRSGYGAHSRDICRSLISLDKWDVRIWPVRWGNTPQNALSEQNPKDIPIIQRLLKSPEVERQPEFHVHIVVPNEFSAIGKYNIGITAGIETTLCPPVWLEGLNRMNLNIVPANFVKETIDRSVYDKANEQGQKVGQVKCERPIEVLFEGADTDIYGVTNEFSKDLIKEFETIKEDWCFLFVGHWLQGSPESDRKDVGSLVRTFIESFKDTKEPPALILKTSGATPCILDREEILKKVDDIKSSIEGKLPPIYILHGDLRDEEINQLYNHPKVKAHVTFTHGEGFGRPLLEASLSEKPVIASNWSGHLDFLNSEFASLVPGELKEIHSSAVQENLLIEKSKWFSPDINFVSLLLKDYVNSYKSYQVNGKRLGYYCKTNFSFDIMQKKLEEVLDENAPKKVEIKLPNIKKISLPKKDV